MTLTSLQLPGVRFAPAAPARSARARLDVPGFVGFAERGPVDRPVRVASFQEFDAIFGGEVVLARDGQGAVVRTQLRGSVASFFEQGGGAAWVVRIAGDGARPAAVSLPGLALHHGGRFTGAVVDAAWPGAFGDGLECQVQAEFEPLPADALARSQTGALTAQVGSEHVVEAGATLVLDGDGRTFVCAVGEGLTLDYVLGVRAPVPGESLSVAVTLLGGEDASLGAGTLGEADGSWTLALAEAPEVSPARGDVLRLTAGGTVLLTAVTDAAEADGAAALMLTSDVVLEHLDNVLPDPPEPDAGFDSIRRVTATVTLHESGGRVARIDRAALHVASEGYLGARLLTESGSAAGDENDDDPRDVADAWRLWTATDEPPRDDESLQPLGRGALAARLAPLRTVTATLDPVYTPTAIPVGLLTAALRDARGTVRTAGDDGLDTLPWERFVDPALARTTAASLLATAHAHRYVWGRRPLGLHALLAVDEVALLALPDAVHAPWTAVTTEVTEELPPAGEEPAPACPADFADCEPLEDDSGGVPAPEPWSATVAEQVVGAVELAPLVEVQRVAAALAEARGDLMVVLALPRGYDVAAVGEWRRALRGACGLPPAGFAGEDARQIADLGLIAVAHPWLVVPSDDGSGHRSIPPDGALCGVLARRERTGGPWSSPGSQPIRGALGIEPWFERPALEALAAEQVVTLDFRAREARFQGAPTQADVARLLPIGVRRLLQFVRRECERLGDRWVFDVNGDGLEEDVRVELNGLLEDLFARGGLAGDAPAEAFELAVGAHVDPDAADRGELVVRLRVAPSHPLEFIEVRLVRAGDELHWSATEV